MNQKLSASIRAQKKKKLNPNKWNNLLVMQLDNHILPFFISCSHPAVTPHCCKFSQTHESTLYVLCCHLSDWTMGVHYILQQIEIPIARSSTVYFSIPSPFPFSRRLNPKSNQIKLFKSNHKWIPWLGPNNLIKVNKSIPF